MKPHTVLVLGAPLSEVQCEQIARRAGTTLLAHSTVNADATGDSSAGVQAVDVDAVCDSLQSVSMLVAMGKASNLPTVRAMMAGTRRQIPKLQRLLQRAVTALSRGDEGAVIRAVERCSKRLPAASARCLPSTSSSPIPTNRGLLSRRYRRARPVRH